MKNELIELFMNDWNETRFDTLTVVRYEAVKVLHNNNVPGVKVDSDYNTPEPFHRQPENIRLMVEEAQEAAYVYLVSQPEYHEAVQRKVDRANMSFDEALKNATPEELYYLKHGTKGEF